MSPPEKTMRRVNVTFPAHLLEEIDCFVPRRTPAKGVDPAPPGTRLEG